MGINMNTITTTTCHKIDIHSHLIYDVDDGSETIEQTIEALKQIKKYNIEKIICTPHFNSFETHKNIFSNFKFMYDGFKKHNIELYLGFELKLNYKNINTLKKLNYKISNYILVEFNRNENMNENDTIDLINELIDMGYIVILAHPEFYINYRKIKFIKKLRENNIIIQCDATSFIKKFTNYKSYKFVNKLLKNDLIDIIASDYHDNKIRNYDNFNKCYNIISKKYGFEIAENLFYNNPKIITDDYKKKLNKNS